MIISESFTSTSRNVQIQKNNDHIKVSADLQKSNKSYNTNQVFEYKGGHLENREGNFFLKSINKSKNQRIPKNIFRTFKCEYKEDIKKTWTEKNPDYNYYFFNDDECLNMIKNNFSTEVYETYMSLSNGAPKADLWRCCVLYLYGGVYVDIDCECQDDIHDSIKDYDFVVPVDTERARYALFNAFMASTPRNNILYHLINKIIYNVKNKNYQERHNYNGDAFTASGPGALGEAVSELLGYSYQTLYSESILNVSVPYFKKINIGSQYEDIYYLPKKDNDNKLLFYYNFSDNNNNNWKYNFDINKNNDYHIIKKKNPDNEKGWNNNLEVACHNSSSKTITESFYFGEYNYNIGSSLDNIKTIEIYHNEYEKLIMNSKYLNVDFTFLVDNSNNNIYHPKFRDIFTFTIIDISKNILTLELKRIDHGEGWGMNLDISIYYTSLIIDTNIQVEDLLVSKLCIYDFIDYIKSKTIKIDHVNSSLNYSYEIIPNSSKIKISITNYELFLPIYSIINIIIPNINYPENQKINLIWHNQTPEFISFNNKKIVISQVCQKEKENIITSYATKPIYRNEYFHEKPFQEKKVAVICSFPYHYEMFGFLITFNNNIPFYANIENDNYQYNDFYKKTFNINFNSIKNFNHENYDIIINHTDDDIKNFNIPSDKIIIIEHEYHHRCQNIHKKRILSLNKFNYDKRPVILPVSIYIDKISKRNLMSNENKINIIYFNNIKEYFKIDDFDEKIKNILDNTSNKYDINFYYRPSNSNNNLINILSSNNKINLTDIQQLSSIKLMDYYKKCHYSIIGNEQIKHSGSITNSLSCGCQLLVSRQRSKSINSSSMICIDNIQSLEININYDKIYDDVEYNISKNNKLLYESINNIYEDLF